MYAVKPGNTKGGSITVHCMVDLLFDWFGISWMTTDNFCFYLQNRLIQTGQTVDLLFDWFGISCMTTNIFFCKTHQSKTGQTGGQWYSDTSPFSIPWLNRS